MKLLPELKNTCLGVEETDQFCHMSQSHVVLCGSVGHSPEPRAVRCREVSGVIHLWSVGVLLSVVSVVECVG